MRKNHPTILFAVALFLVLRAGAQVTAYPAAAAPLSAIQAALDDGFYALAEQRARSVLYTDASIEEKREATFLLAHALWGQQRYKEMLALLSGHPDDPGYAYWRARADFELKRYETALKDLSKADMKGSPFAPAALRLKGHIEQRLGKSADAEKTFRQFKQAFPGHPERIENQFDLARLYADEGKITEAVAQYREIAAGKNQRAAEHARLELARLLRTRGSEKDIAPARALLEGLATNDTTRLACRIDACIELSSLEKRAGNAPAAIQALRQAIELSPDTRQSVPLKLSLARMLLQEGNTDEALKLLEQCRNEAPDEAMAAEVQLEKANALLQAGRYREANTAFQVYLDVASDPEGESKAYFGKGLALWNIGRFPVAAAAFDKAGTEKALFKAGDSWFKAGKFDEAAKRYQAFAEKYPDSPLLPNALYQLGLAQAKVGQTAEAMATFQTLETKCPESPFAEKAALRTADLLMAQAQWEAALEKYTRIGQAYTNSATAALSLHRRGLLLYRMKRYKEAQGAFEKVIADYPDSEYAPQASYMRGFCLYYQGKVDEAVKTCQTFVEKYPDSEWTPDVVFWLAEHHFNNGNYTEAEPLFTRIATTYTNNALVPDALYWAGRSEAAQANYVKALEYYGKVAKQYPKSEVIPQVRFAQGDALSELGEFARAILAFDEIIKKYPDNHLVNAAWGRKGDCQFSLAADDPARYAEAIKSYQTILDRPSAPVALKLQAEYKLGRCLEKTGKTDKAFSRYMNVVYTFLDPEEPVVRSVRNVTWFTRAAFGAAALKEREKAWVEAARVYRRVVEADVPASAEAAKRIEKIKKDNWLLFQRAEEKQPCGN